MGPALFGLFWRYFHAHSLFVDSCKFLRFWVLGGATARIVLGIFLVGAFLKKRVDYSHGFSSVYFLRPPELTKIVLPKVLQNFKFHLLAQGTEPKSFPHNIQCRTRPKGFFFGIARLFSEKKFPQRVPPSIFLGFAICDRLGIEKSQRVPLSIFFGVVRLFSKKNLCCRREYFETLMSFRYFWALDMAPTWAGPGLFHFILIFSQNWKPQSTFSFISIFLSFCV